MESLLKGKDVALALSISRAYAYRLIYDGKIPAIRIGRSVRVKPSDLTAFVEKSYLGDHKLDISQGTIEKPQNNIR
jgi:excisionase family DNA binding protein